jgi:hypothetical protein
MWAFPKLYRGSTQRYITSGSIPDFCPNNPRMNMPFANASLLVSEVEFDFSILQLEVWVAPTQVKFRQMHSRMIQNQKKVNKQAFANNGFDRIFIESNL